MNENGGGKEQTLSSKDKNISSYADASSDAFRHDEFPVVGIGASAGGLAALEDFFSAVPADTSMGIAFVVVQHMSPDHKSMLSEIIRRFTKMQIFDVKDGMGVRPDCVYIIPPSHDMIIMDGILHLTEPAEARGHRMPIDSFFHSLASDKHGWAIGVVLSGTGSDGTAGVRTIKAEGGMIMAQSPESSDYNGMPLSVIDTGLVDYILEPAEMPAQLRDYISQMYVSQKSDEKPRPTHKIEDAMQMIFNELLVKTGHDFSQYKQKTLDRRIRRRMVVNNIKRMEGYAHYLQQKPEEVQALFRDILINVTNFFRNPRAFEVLQEKVVPKLFEDRSPGTEVRIWVVGCSTGEEAYSIGILIHEHMEKSKQNFKVQIFATDIDSRTIERARKGVYPGSISSDISPERLEHFFTHDPKANTYTIQNNIREMIIFSEQDVIKDPPFSKLDLISCRNLLIYMNKEMQKKLIPMFHYSLNPGGFLFLGSSESIGEFSMLFDTLDRQSKLYQSKDVNGDYRHSMGKFFPSPVGIENPPRVSDKHTSGKRLQMRELAERKLLQQYAPAGALINERGDILYLHGRTGLYLEMAPGEPAHNILKMAREGLRPALTTALSKAMISKEQVTRSGVRVRTNGNFTTVNLTLRPVGESIDQKLFMVTFDVPPESGQNHGQVTEESIVENISEEDESVSALKEELRTMEEYLRASNEELEVSNEELRSSNEEMQSMNEELQSTNEELETSREELQSVNEELSTVNNELQAKVAELSEANEDMNNLLASTGVGIVFVDNQLRIQRFTPAVTKVLNLIPSDVGRPIEHTVSNFTDYDNLIPDIKSVLDSLTPKEVEVHTISGEWYTVKMRPYRTNKNTIEGVVITFLKQTEILRRLAAVVSDSTDAVTLLDKEGHILAWNPMAEKMYGWSEADALKMNASRMVPEDKKEEFLDTMKKLGKGEIPEPYKTQRVAKDGRILDVWVIATSLVNEDGEMYSIATTEREIESHDRQKDNNRAKPQ
ncbi:chemotaxis protein CheR [Methanolobus halotolerans]|uniref:Chemotaxis protein CheR n=2 Tax=Methanolobus halotolerans TaxID=2052935 RepID=A0A4E0Q7M6_9EURY|nr:chemotaxis protein CheR [Methanolobus halotolerans]